MIAKEIFDGVAGLLNDTLLTNFTYVAQQPMLQIALDELQEMLELDNVPITNKVTSTPISVAAGVTGIGDTLAGQQPLPPGLVEIQELWEQVGSSTVSYIPMTRVDFIPLTMVQTAQLQVWAWIGEKIQLLGATNTINVKIEFIQSVFLPIINENTPINMINSKSFLKYRTAGLCAEFIGENPTRAADLNTLAQLAVDRTLGISAKGRQSIAIRRKPFRASYKMRGTTW
jgi:hypothetical protein